MILGGLRLKSGRGCHRSVREENCERAHPQRRTKPRCIFTPGVSCGTRATRDDRMWNNVEYACQGSYPPIIEPRIGIEWLGANLSWRLDHFVGSAHPKIQYLSLLSLDSIPWSKNCPPDRIGRWKCQEKRGCTSFFPPRGHKTFK